ncbi:hypothetical protein ACFL6I_11610 [candidate division KSB1 bacterium]
MIKAHYKIIPISLIIFLLVPFFTSAQLAQELENILVLSVNPTYPGPNERVTISAESFSIDLNSSTVSWFINGVLEQQSIGGKVFQFTTRDLGSSTDIDIVAETSDGSLNAEQITIRPTDADLIWQGNTLTHPLYKGRHIPSIGSTINIEAMPHFLNDAGHKLGTDELVYSWRIDGKALPNASGRGKNTITVSQTKPVKAILAEVEIESSDKLLSRKERLSIPVQDSELLIYENNPLLGVLFNKAINGLYSLVGQETKFLAYPFFMSTVDRNASYINYSWRLNNNPIVLGEDKGSITVGHAGGESGKAEITVSAQNNKDIFQKSDSGFTIEFGTNTSSGFGF